jgi:hypothetical protein
MGKFISSIIAAVFAVGVAQAAEQGTHKVVYHINSADKAGQMAALRNVQNHINAVKGEKLDLRIVMHGDGVSLMQNALTDENVKSTVDKLKTQGIAFNICANTLTGKKLDYKKDLYDVTQKDIVPSGVAELAKLQQQGFAYVKP